MDQDIPFKIQADDKFGPLIEVFTSHFETGRELGASFCVFDGDDCIVELVGGWADRAKSEAFTQDHLVSVYSSGKTAAALVIAWLADQDRLGYNQEIRSIWPEFDKFGKGQLSVAQILSHQHGLPGITDPDWTPEDWYDWDKTCETLAAQKPLWEPGTASGYSPTTYGFLVGEIAKRVDQHSRTLGQILREELCDPAGLDVWIGLPEQEHERCAYMKKPTAMADFGEITEAKTVAFLRKSSATGGRPMREWRKAEFPGSNCQASAKSLAHLQQLALTGRLGGITYLSEDIIAQLHTSRISGENLVLPFEIEFAAGYMKNAPNFFFGPNPNTLGHSGWGGSCVFADPATELSGAYVMTKQDNSLLGDLRSVALVNAFYDCY